MNLGEMEMDSEKGISFSDGASEQSSSEEYREGAGDNPDDLFRDAVRQVPRPIIYLVVVAGVLGGAGIGLAFLLGLLPVFALFPAAFLASLAVFGGGAALYVRRDSRGDTSPEKSKRQRRLVNSLNEANSPLRVEDLQNRFGWSEKETVDALASLVEQGEIEEDLDPDTGHWVYELANEDRDALDQVDRRSLPVEERRTVLEEEE